MPQPPLRRRSPGRCTRAEAAAGRARAGFASEPLKSPIWSAFAARALTRAREDLVGTRVGLANELRAQLACFWPGAADVHAEIDSPIALVFLRRYPSPADARGLGEQRMARFLQRHGYSARRTPSELLERLRTAAQGRAGTLETEARRQVVLALVAALAGQYEADPSLTFADTLAMDTSPGLYGGTDFWASLMMQLAKRHGGQTFVARFWHHAADLPAGSSTTDAVTNWVQDASYAACTDLSPVFYVRWGFPRPDGSVTPRPPASTVPEPQGHCWRSRLP